MKEVSWPERLLSWSLFVFVSSALCLVAGEFDGTGNVDLLFFVFSDRATDLFLGEPLDSSHGILEPESDEYYVLRIDVGDALFVSPYYGE